jgi:BASS family bile acid:Na+ symporter
MASHESVESVAAGRAARFVQQHFLWLLVACYALAAVLPGPGLKMRTWQLDLQVDGNHVNFPLILLAWMLFCAALMTDLTQVRTVLRHPFLLGAALVSVWLGPALLVLAAGWFVPMFVNGDTAAGLLVGLALVAAMPVANSSVGWAQNTNGNLALALALVVLSISLSPWITPQLLEWLGSSLSAKEQQLCEELVTRFSGWFFVIWVICPTALGFVVRTLAGRHQVARVGDYVTLGSAAALLVLNYINSSLALPKIGSYRLELLGMTAILAVAASLVGLALAGAISYTLKLSSAAASALFFGLSMKHTGLALILAAAVLENQPLAILLIALATLAQHILAAVVQWLYCRGFAAAAVKQSSMS